MCMSDIVLGQGIIRAPSGIECPPHKRGAWVLSGVAVTRQSEESSKSICSIGFPREGLKKKSDQSVVNYSSYFSFGTCGMRRLGRPWNDTPSATEAEHLEAIREHRDRMRSLERMAGEYARTGQGRVSDFLEGRIPSPGGRPAPGGGGRSGGLARRSPGSTQRRACGATTTRSSDNPAVVRLGLSAASQPRGAGIAHSGSLWSSSGSS